MGWIWLAGIITAVIGGILVSSSPIEQPYKAILQIGIPSAIIASIFLLGGRRR